ncbi:MAG TPA: phosphotransferase [Cellulomonas sp.]|uniref:phosphotransferase enzyme family protein n=1 Tax=Cellulomonas sp. TaxID=40001 RepID=UPI002E307D72|nr:phosphotransferase [Cellulomonas sp.]HEX5331371.1 phosphotransferase [Cellulomonas sp.]
MTTEQLRAPQDAEASIHAFDSLTKGEPAPRWLTAGILAAWGLDERTTRVALIAVSENATFLVRQGVTPTAVVRVARPGYMTGTADFESEVAWVAALASSGVARVPAGIPTVAGGFVASIADADGVSWSCVSYAYVPGSILEDIADPVPYYREIGRTTALLHDHAQAWNPPASFQRHSWELPDMVGPTSRWGRWQDAALAPAEHLLLMTAERAALDVLADSPRTPETWGLIHADLRPSNIMISDDTLTVIDFDDCGYSWFLYDFASALTFMEHVEDAPTMAAEWVAGYLEVRPITTDDARTACALSMIRRLQMLGWTTTHRSDALPQVLWDAQPSGTVEVAARYLASHTWLLD